MVLPASEVADVPGAELRGPTARRVDHGVVEADREEHGAALLQLPVQRLGDLELDSMALHRRLGQDEQQFVKSTDGRVDAAREGVPVTQGV
ncbi:MAG TPA: hypothetical protein VGD58_24505 [Herpetosiphonaceae bacterium]